MPYPTTLLVLVLTVPLMAQAGPDRTADLREEIERWNADRALVARRYDTPLSAAARERKSRVHREQLTALGRLDWQTLGPDARVDWLLLRAACEHELDQLSRDQGDDAALAPLLAFAPPLVALHEAWRDLEDVAPEPTAAVLTATATAVLATRDAVAAGRHAELPPHRARAAVNRLDALRRAMAEWFGFHDGYHPEFSWWCRAPWQQCEEALRELRTAVQQKLVDLAGDATLVGNPIGRDDLETELLLERIPYSPAELVQIAEREFAWCDGEMKDAANAMGCDDWRAALERVKGRHVAPGEQPALIRALAFEAIEFLEERDLITIPPLCRDGWRMSMMSPEAQRVNPFFLGGEVIQVSFPTDGMPHDAKLQSLRSNNEHFCRATVHHELIPGHWLQHYMQARHRSYRRVFSTPFWIEGWALYWEMRLYDLGLAKTPEDRVGMLYWRKHRCARIVFSLNYHLGEWDARRCIAYLIDRVGHEPAAAEAEVRRSLTGGYGPLYQAAYMLGGLQFRALHGELVATGKLTEKAFHDAVLQQNSIPIALVRAALRPDLSRDEIERGWRFADLSGGR